MHKLLLGGIALAALTGQALAGDLPSRKEAPVYAAPAPVFTWTGFYIGAQAGYAFGHSSIDDYYKLALSTGMAGPQSLSPDGGLGGLHLGYNYQIGSWVLGVDGQFDWGSFSNSGSVSYPFLFPGNIFTLHRTVRANDLATVGARLGYAFNNVLLYAKGGLALTQWKYQDFSSDALFGPYFSSYASATNNTAGWFVGAGAEYAFNNNWSANIEYRYIGFGRETSDLVQTLRWERAFGSIPLGIASSLQTIEFGVTYHFGVAEAAPVVAKY